MSNFMPLLHQYVRAVNALALATHPTPEQRAHVRALGEQVLHHAERANQRKTSGPRAHVVAAAERRRNQQFTLAWRASGAERTLTGWDALQAETGLQVSSLRVMFSKGGGRFDRAMLDQHGNPDIVTITRL